MSGFDLRLDGRPIRNFPTVEQCAVEAFERGLVVSWNTGSNVALVDGAEIVPASVNDARFGDWMQTYRGAPFWPMDPRPDEIHILDIAHSLSMLCRYNGHCVRFYSVAEHSVHVSRAVPQEHALWGLLHDASEAYLADVPRPVKPFLPGYKGAEGRLQLAIAERFGLPAAIPPEVHDADNRILVDEKEQAMLPSQREWSIPPFGIGARISFWDPGRAEQEFMRRYNELTRVPECLMAGAA